MGVTIHGLAVEAPVVALLRWLQLLPVLPLFPHQHGPRGLPGSVACYLRGHSVASLLAPVGARRTSNSAPDPYNSGPYNFCYRSTGTGLIPSVT